MCEVFSCSQSKGAHREILGKSISQPVVVHILYSYIFSGYYAGISQFIHVYSAIGFKLLAQIIPNLVYRLPPANAKNSLCGQLASVHRDAPINSRVLPCDAGIREGSRQQCGVNLEILSGVNLKRRARGQNCAHLEYR